MCEIAYAATRRDLWTRRAELAPMLKRHGLTLKPDVLQDESRDLWEGVGVQRGGSAPRQSVTERLSRALERLETVVPPQRGSRRRAS